MNQQKSDHVWKYCNRRAEWKQLNDIKTHQLSKNVVIHSLGGFQLGQKGSFCQYSLILRLLSDNSSAVFIMLLTHICAFMLSGLRAKFIFQMDLFTYHIQNIVFLEGLYSLYKCDTDSMCHLIINENVFSTDSPGKIMVKLKKWRDSSPLDGQKCNRCHMYTEH